MNVCSGQAQDHQQDPWVYTVWLAGHSLTETDGHSSGSGLVASCDPTVKTVMLTRFRVGWLSLSHGTLILGSYLWPLTYETSG